ncbi:MAG TPA: hypothetical protein VEW48_26495 [Thermoanaerobaculia bacterium]|nr:hypothetical protein [Thermoanaerobaculia bacterium]
MPQRDENLPTLGIAEKAHADLLEDRRDRYRQAATLLRQWREDDSGYDEKIWPLLEEEFSLTESFSKSR